MNMRKTFLIVPLFLACAEGVPVYVAPGGYECRFHEDEYTATYTRLDGQCGTFETEYFSRDDERSWFPKALDLDDCEQTVTCANGVIEGSSFCRRTDGSSFGTLDGTLTLDTYTGTGSLELTISAVRHYRTHTCNSNYEVIYSQ